MNRLDESVDSNIGRRENSNMPFKPLDKFRAGQFENSEFHSTVS
jgi:hypothetical protein